MMKLITALGGKSESQPLFFSISLFHLCNGTCTGPVGVYCDLCWLRRMQRQIDLHVGLTGVFFFSPWDQSVYAACGGGMALVS